MHRFHEIDPDITRFRSLTLFLVLAAGVAPIAGATIGGGAVVAASAVPWSRLWLNWYAADSLGMIIAAPLALALNLEHLRALRTEKRVAEAFGVLAVVVMAASIVSYQRSLIFIVAPAVLFATFRFRALGAAMATFVIALVVIVCSVNGYGFTVLSQAAVSERIILFQIFLAATTLWALPVAAVLADRDRIANQLSVAKGQGMSRPMLK
jgi:integral membrane sensor domain MASE1